MSQFMLLSPVGQFLMEIKIQPIVVLVIKIYSLINWVCYIQSIYENVHWRTNIHKKQTHTHTHLFRVDRELNTLKMKKCQSSVYFINSGWMRAAFNPLCTCEWVFSLIWRSRCEVFVSVRSKGPPSLPPGQEMSPARSINLHRDLGSNIP